MLPLFVDSGECLWAPFTGELDFVVDRIQVPLHDCPVNEWSGTHGANGAFAEMNVLVLTHPFQSLVLPWTVSTRQEADGNGWHRGNLPGRTKWHTC